MPAEVLDVRSLPAISSAGLNWRRVRHTLGVSAFGTNAYTADRGGLLIEEHDEAGGHEELYVVLHGRATFVIDGKEVDAPAGSLVFVNPEERRVAHAAEDGTTALVVGGTPGAAGPPSAWEHSFAGEGESDPARAYEVVAQGLADHPDDAGIHLELARHAEASGRREQAAEHLRKALEANPRVREWMDSDEDYAAIRDLA